MVLAGNVRMGKKMNTKSGKVFIAFLLALAITCLCSCDKVSNRIFKTDRITEIYFVSCTDPNNAFYMNEEKLDFRGRRLLKQKEALELAHEVEKIPDSSPVEGECSYIIRIKYIEDGVEKNIEKNGYDTFPENWDDIIDLTNIVSGEYHGQITNSTELAVIDANYFREYNLLPDESIIPEGMSVDDVIKGADITYLTIYDPISHGYTTERRVRKAITDYVFDYYDLKSHQIDGIDGNHPKSSEDEMREFAESRLDEYNSNNCTEYNCWGTYNGESYLIIRYDMVRAWLADEEEKYYRSSFTSSYHQYEVTIKYEVSAFRTSTWNVFVDGSGKFLILTESENPAYIAAVVK